MKLSRVQALGILIESSNHDDPHWEQCCEMVLGDNLKEDDDLPTVWDVFGAIRIPKYEVNNAMRQGWRTQDDQ